MLNDAQWARIEDKLPGRVGTVGVTAKDNRLFVEGILWLGRTGSPIRDLPGQYGNWNSVHKRFRRWSQAGVWTRVLEVLKEEADMEWLMIDSTVVRAHQHAAGAKRGSKKKS